MSWTFDPPNAVPYCNLPEITPALPDRSSIILPTVLDVSYVNASSDRSDEIFWSDRTINRNGPPGARMIRPAGGHPRSYGLSAWDSDGLSAGGW